MRTVILAICSVLLSFEVVAQDLPKCDVVLMQPNVSVLNTDSHKASAWLSLVNQSNYEQAKRSAGAKYKAVFGANYSDFKERFSSLLSIQQSSWEHDEARSEMHTSLSREQIEAWATCIEATTSNNVLTLAAIDPTADDATVIIRWRPAGGIAEIRNVSVNVIGATPDNTLSKISTIAPGSRAFILKRSASNRRVRVTVSGTVGNGFDVHSEMLLPPIESATSFSPVSRTEARNAARSGSIGDVVDVILRGWDVNDTVDDEGNLMLHAAAESCSRSKVDALLDAESSAPANRWNDTPHSIATARCGPHHAVTIRTAGL